LPQDTPDSELDSGISVNGNYDDPRLNNHPPEIYEQIEEMQSNDGESRFYNLSLPQWIKFDP
jgi:hypothetical protein